MDISHLKEFTVLADTKNYWEASYRLFLNQSTLSKHIKAMERELGVPLFERTTRRVELTEFGAALLPYAQSIVRTQFEYSARLLQIQNHQRGVIAIGSLPAMAQYDITDILLAFQKEYPENSIRITEDDPKLLLELLNERQIELVFLRETAAPPRLFDEAEPLERIPYLQDFLVAVLPNHHPLADKPELTLRDLRNERFAFIKEHSMMSDLCCQACQQAGFIPNIVFSSHRLDSILDMVTKGGCTALLMNYHVKFPLESPFSMAPPFTVVPIAPAIQTRISLCWQKGANLSPAASHFVTFFQGFVREHALTGGSTAAAPPDKTPGSARQSRRFEPPAPGGPAESQESCPPLSPTPAPAENDKSQC